MPNDQLPKTHSAMKLSRELKAAGLTEMAERAAKGEYHDYLSEHPFPEIMLMTELQQAYLAGNPEAGSLLERHMNGEFDATLEESNEWAASPDGQAAYRSLFGNGKL